MNIRWRSVYSVVILIIMVITLIILGLISGLSDIGQKNIAPGQLTASFIVATNHALETFVLQTQTATAQVKLGTLTPTPTS